MTRAARMIQTADLPLTRSRRQAPSPTRSAQLAIAFDDEPEGGPGLPLRHSSDWAGFREGAREVFVTLMATLVIGLAWAALEAGRLSADLASPVAVSDRESR